MGNIKNSYIFSKILEQGDWLGVKFEQFKKWKEITDLMIKGEHTTKEGFLKIIKIKDIINKKTYQHTKRRYTLEYMEKVLNGNYN